MDDSVFYASISELSERLRKREFSSVELTKAFCDRLEKLGPRYNALALPLREHAIRKAKSVDGDLKKERFRSPLQGIPYGAKDLLSFAGQPTAWGAAPFAGQVFKEDATVVKKLDKVGAVRRPDVPLRRGVGHRAGAEPVGPYSLVRRLVERLGERSGRGARRLCVGLGDLGFDPHALGLLRHHRPAADVWTRQPRGCDGAVVDAR
jgi:hypothetical protein